MQTFKYSGISPDGANVSGVVEAFNQYDALTKINKSCSVVTKLTAVSNDSISTKLFGNRKINTNSLAMMCSQLAIILKSGLPIVRAIELVSQQISDKELKKIMLQVAEDVSQGIDLARSFETKNGVFPLTFIETVRSGEKSGTLEKSFEKLNVFFTKTSKMKSKVISALLYPAFTIVVAIIVIGVIMIVAVPQFTSSFATLGIELPLPTRILISTSNFMTKYILIILLLLALLIFGIKMYSRTEKGREKLSAFSLKVPIFGKLNIMKASSQFANTMSTLIAAGLSVIDAVESTGQMLDNYVFGKQISSATASLEEGKRMAEILRKCKFVPTLLAEMVAVGEETGTLESTLDVIGAFYDNETEVAAKRALTLLQPIIITILAIIIVVILLAVYLPMFSMYSAMGA